MTGVSTKVVLHMIQRVEVAEEQVVLEVVVTQIQMDVLEEQVVGVEEQLLEAQMDLDKQEDQMKRDQDQMSIQGKRTRRRTQKRSPSHGGQNNTSHQKKSGISIQKCSLSSWRMHSIICHQVWRAWTA